jgi:gliding motility-associated lipoprotein GldJ
MAGNVAEWVMDVYRQVSGDDMTDLNPYRGNYYTTPKLLDDGTIDDRIDDGDKVGQVPMVPVSDFKNDRRRNYRAADNKNFLDGDWASTYGGGNTEVWQRQGRNEKANLEMYGKTAYPRGTYSLVEDKAKVYKGGSWQDMQYWLSPGQRRFLDENEATAYIGFRCAMARVGYPNYGK